MDDPRQVISLGKGALARCSLRPYWWDTGGQNESLACEPASSLPQEVDVAIIGGGYTGLSAALTLARAGRSVAVLDAHWPGFGCSSRNGGLLGPSFHKLGYQGLLASVGEAAARDILAESMDALTFVKDFIDAEAIDCGFHPSGRFRGAARPAHYEGLARQAEDLRAAVGLAFDMVPRGEQRVEIGSDHYHGGIVYHQDGHLHPALYLRGLGRRALAAGARLFSGAPVTALRPATERFELMVAGRRLVARQVLLATNGYTGKPFAYHRRRVIPLRSAMIATEPLGAGRMKELSPNNRGFGDTSRLVLYYRPSPDGERMVFGGRAFDIADRPARYVPDLYRLMTRIFPQLRGVALSHAWSGTVAYTFDHAPHIGQLDGLYFAMGYCGSGVGRATYFGRKVALKMLDDPEGRTSLDGLAFSTRPFYSGHPWFLPVVLRWHSWADRLGI
jgi:glycine/D-amino acid oxidase-like deaminating enzyme